MDYLLPLELGEVPAQVGFIAVLVLNSSYRFRKISRGSQALKKPLVFSASRDSPLGDNRKARVSAWHRNVLYKGDPSHAS